MDAVSQTQDVTITLSLSDMSVLSDIKKALKLYKGVESVKTSTAPKTKMTEAEFYEKINKSVESAKKGRVYKMQDGESTSDFIDRLLCIG